MISMELLREGYCSGVVRIEDEDFIGGAACFIGDSHFYFEIGDEGSSDNYSSEELLNIYDEEELLECIFLTLENFREDWEDMGNEYQYYDFYLHEQLGIPYDE